MASANQARGEDYYLPLGQSYLANIYRVANNIELLGDINGDVFVIGNNITIAGNIKGDVYAIAANIRVTGIIEGSLRAAGQNITIDSEIKHGVTLAGNNIYLNDKAKLGATLMVYGQNIEMRGQVAGNVDGGMEKLFISGQLTHLNAEVGQLVLSSTAVVNGNLNYQSRNMAEVPSGAIVKGQHNFSELKKNDQAQVWQNKISGIFYRLLSLLLLGLLLIKLMPSTWRTAVADPQNKYKYILYGLVLSVVTPLVMIVLFITIIGIPLSLILLAIYLILLYSSAVYVGYLIGSWIANRWQLKWPWPYIYLLGLFIYLVLTALPWIGWLVMLLGVWWGLGGLMMMKKDIWQKLKNQQ
ncbi:MAG: hypothetical protein COX77_04145 [Candidatus Komeilibacteria bacterium CG_4_10_14_0_2_um_filter_37_10]|uniref:DUF8173 domain-containing protein n=1 Tax=Candidatus Komeilibacteria bacterium CG_4_10_14_0_2_um_filter_37_10 TaxID=1974470 RepID=A0A2M7VDM8_9BACT|nr:MAG: hypothetical protein COX77_04145 [Candidatus Komeilibacteria bacterium CG_4_10_14_0_2_um_filter_37_10]